MSGRFGYYTSLALDSADRPHIAYQQSQSRTIKYLWLSGTTWLSETVDSGNEGTDAWTSLALDRADNPHLVYVVKRPGNYYMTYAWRSQGDWYTSTVDTVGEESMGSLALDNASHPVIGYYTSNSTYDLRYATPTWRYTFIPLLLRGY